MHKIIIVIILKVEGTENLPLDHTGFSFTR